ncbi:hypothetical protein KKG81_04690, partial [bacterium]|nr:hypothetical protein [bacterium]
NIDNKVLVGIIVFCMIGVIILSVVQKKEYSKLATDYNIFVNKYNSLISNYNNLYNISNELVEGYMDLRYDYVDLQHDYLDCKNKLLYYNIGPESHVISNLTLTEKDFGYGGTYYGSGYYCVWVKGHNLSNVKYFENHEICHAMVADDYNHFCEGD